MSPELLCSHPQSEFETQETFDSINLDSIILGKKAKANIIEIDAAFAIPCRILFAFFLAFDATRCCSVYVLRGFVFSSGSSWGGLADKECMRSMTLERLL
jgi:uncharacterized MAPEG superfamily protein